MANIIGKVVGRLYVPDEQRKATAARGYHRDPSNPKFPFGQEVTLIEVRDYEADEQDRKTSEWRRVQRQGGAGSNEIILGPKLRADGSVIRDIIGIGDNDFICDFQIDPKAEVKEGHATLIIDHGNSNDFAEFTGMWNGKRLSA